MNNSKIPDAPARSLQVLEEISALSEAITHTEALLDTLLDRLSSYTRVCVEKEAVGTFPDSDDLVPAAQTVRDIRIRVVRNMDSIQQLLNNLEI